MGKYYKISNNRTCLDFKYEVGKTYTTSELEVCRYGLHYCDDADLLFGLYEYDKDKTVIFEVEPLGEVVQDENQGVFATDKLFIKRIVEPYEYNSLFKRHVFDGHYSLIQWTTSGGLMNTVDYEYDDNGNKTKTKFNTTGIINTWKYDKVGNIIENTWATDYRKVIETWQYDEYNNVIHAQYLDIDDPDENVEVYYKYDEHHNLISKHDEYTDETHAWYYEYDANNNVIKKTYKDENGDCIVTEFKYDDIHNMIEKTVLEEPSILKWKYAPNSHIMVEYENRAWSTDLNENRAITKMVEDKTYNLDMVEDLMKMETNQEEISGENFATYEAIRVSGLTNMFDIKQVISLSDGLLTEKTIKFIMKNYGELIKKYGKIG